MSEKLFIDYKKRRAYNLDTILKFPIQTRQTSLTGIQSFHYIINNKSILN